MWRLPRRWTTEDRYGILLPMNPDYLRTHLYPFLWMAGADVVNEDFNESDREHPGSGARARPWGTLVRNGWALKQHRRQRPDGRALRQRP